MDRPRLTNLLSDADVVRVVLIHAPAGSGKTTLLEQMRQSLSKENVHVVWHTVSDNEHDPLSLPDHLLRSLASSGPSEPGPATGLSIADVAAKVRSRVAGLCAAERVAILIDDFHLAKQPDANETIADLLKISAPNFLLIVAGRTLPQVPVARLRANGALIEITGAELRFDIDETVQFFRMAGEEPLSPEECRLVEDRVEGWAAGLRLIALRLGRAADRRSVFTAAMAGGQRDFAAYFLEEVMADLDPEDLSLVMGCCILEAMHPDLCTVLTGRADAETVLERLELGNFFTTRVQDKPGWYRFHHLFLDFLRARLLAEGARDTAALHRRAATWFVGAGQAQEAVRHAFLAEDPSWAAELIERYCVFDYLSYGRFDVYHRWMRQLPADVRSARPLLSFLLVWRYINLRRFAQAEQVLREIERLCADPASPAARIATEAGLQIDGRAHLMRALIGAYGANLGSCRAHIDAIGARQLDDGAFGQVDVDSIHSYLAFHDGELERASRLTWKAHRRYEELACQWGMIHSRCIAAMVETAAGRLEDSRPLLEDTLFAARTAFAEHSYMVMLPASLLGANLYEAGRMQEAEPLLQSAVRNHSFDGALGLAERVTIPAIALTRLLDSLSRVEEADTVLMRASRMAYQAEDIRLDFELAVERADRAFRQRRFLDISSDLARVDTLVDEARRAFPSSTWVVWQPYEILEVRRLTASGRLTDALSRLSEMIARAEHSGRQSHSALLRLLAKTIAPEASESPLTILVNRCRDVGLFRSLLDLCDPDVASLVMGSSPIDEEPVRRPAAFLKQADGLTRRERMVVECLKTGLSNQEIGATLDINVHTVKTHLKSVYAKMGVRSRAQAIVQAREPGTR